MNAKAQQYIESKLNQITNETDAETVINSFSTAKIQLSFLKGAEDIICEVSAKKSSRGISYADVSVLSHQILMGQQTKVDSFGDKAFKLSDRQVSVMASALFQIMQVLN